MPDKSVGAGFAVALNALSVLGSSALTRVLLMATRLCNCLRRGEEEVLARCAIARSFDGLIRVRRVDRDIALSAAPRL